MHRRDTPTIKSGAGTNPPAQTAGRNQFYSSRKRSLGHAVLAEDELQEQGEWPYLASAIEWIALRGEPAVASRAPEDWDRAERELFAEIAKSG